MDLIYESYKQSYIMEAFKSKTLSQLFKTVKSKRTKPNYWDRSAKVGEDGMMPDKDYQLRVKETLGYLMSQIDASNIPESSIEVLPVDTFRKKKNKMFYRHAIFVKDGLPLFHAIFYDDGTISNVSEVGSRSHMRGYVSPKLKDALEESDVVIAIGNIEKYFKIGLEKNRARWASKADALALVNHATYLSNQVYRYKKQLAQNKANDNDVEGKTAAMVKLFQEFLGYMSKTPMTIADFNKYGQSESMKISKGMEGIIQRAQEVMKDVKNGFPWGGSKTHIESLVNNMAVYASITRGFMDTGTLSDSQKKAMQTIRSKNPKS